MKVIIIKTNEVKDVSLGHALNFLLPKKLAVVATKQKLEELKKKKVKAVKIEKDDLMKNRQMAEKLDGKVVEIKSAAGKTGKIHGSITKKEIAGKLKILKKFVKLDKPIKKLGEYEVELVFGKARAKVKIKVKTEK